MAVSLGNASAGALGGLGLRTGDAVRRRGPRFAVLAGLTCWVLAGGGLVWGQDDWDAVKEPANPAAARGVAVQRFRLPNLDQWVFGGKTPAQIEQVLMSRFTVRLDSVERACELSEDQRRKLELAARGDVKKFFRQVDEVREKFDEMGNDQQKFQKIAEEVQPIQTKINGLFFDDSSLLHRVLKGTLDEEQSRKYEEQERERRRFHYEAKIELTLTMLEIGVPLREQQRQRFVKLLLDETEPPRKFGQLAYYVVLYQIGTVEEEKLEPIFDDAQWRAIKRILSQGKGMEAHLRGNGFM